MQPACWSISLGVSNASLFQVQTLHIPVLSPARRGRSKYWVPKIKACARNVAVVDGVLQHPASCADAGSFSVLRTRSSIASKSSLQMLFWSALQPSCLRTIDMGVTINKSDQEHTSDCTQILVYGRAAHICQMTITVQLCQGKMHSGGAVPQTHR